MEALNALALKPMCLLQDKTSKPRRAFSIPLVKHPNLPPSPNQQILPQTLSSLLKGTTLVFLSPFLSPKVGLALTYEEALQQSINSSSGVEFDTGGSDFFDGILTFAAENPLVIGGGLAILAVPLIVSQFLGKPKNKPFGVAPANKAYAKLSDDPTAELLDIRPPKDVRVMGSPDIRGLRKKPVPITYKSEDKPGFLLKLALKFKEPENTTLFILDKFDGDSELVAELVATNGFKAAYAIKDGAEGSRGWMNSGLPWMLPKKALSFDLSNLIESITGSLPEGSDASLVTLGLAAVTGLGLLAFTEMETLLQVLGLVATIQVTSTKLLTAEDRARTLQQADEFLNTKVVLKEFVSDLKQIGAALLPTRSKAIAAPAKASSGPTVLETPVKEVESTTEMQTTETKVEEVAPETNSVPQTEVKPESHSVLKRPLSPFTQYPDLKPPSSPCPSQPKERIRETISIPPQTEAKSESHSGLKRPLSPFPLYPDLKPPSSPSPSQP